MKLLPVTDAQRAYANAAVTALRRAGVRAEVDKGGDRLAKMIRNAETARTPIICVIGEREVEGNTLAVRSRRGGDLGSVGVDDLVARCRGANEQAIEPHEMSSSSA